MEYMTDNLIKKILPHNSHSLRGFWYEMCLESYLMKHHMGTNHLLHLDILPFLSQGPAFLCCLSFQAKRDPNRL